MKLNKIVLSLAILLFTGQLAAQRGYSSASVTMNRANIVVAPDQVIIEEYLNYHTHNIPLPNRNEEIALSLDYRKMSDNSLIVQAGLTTHQILDYSELAPVNVSLVIDRSGSMQMDNRLEKVKKALLKFVKGLKDDDYISIVAYETSASLILPSTKVGEIENIENIIQSLRPGGSTNLHGGLMLGYQEAKKNAAPNHNNKVILLTDGIANTGITDPETIVQNSVDYNNQGIDISTIGVGSNLNYSLLQQLAHKGKGANHFVGNKEEDFVKVFDEELESLISPIAKEVYLELEYPEGMTLNKVYGYSPEFRNNKILIPLKNVNNGLTQVVLYNFKVDGSLKELPLKAELRYYSYSSKQESEIKFKQGISKTKRQRYPQGEGYSGGKLKSCERQLSFR